MTSMCWVVELVVICGNLVCIGHFKPLVASLILSWRDLEVFFTANNYKPNLGLKKLVCN